MKILEVRFKNLNSLQGEWHIDLTAPEYLANGIFAITGPTGSGKTTILDAISLALYGVTPRLKNVTQSQNEIMSRQTGECFAEVVFSSKVGTFRCHWSQHRAYKKADGKLAAPQHEISDVVSKKVIENKRTKIAAVVEEKTGMDFNRFVRSVLLAQGDFALFLEANDADRSAILEQITGTEVYGLISTKVYERHAAEQAKLEKLEAEIKGIQTLSSEEEQLEKDKLTSKRRDESELLKVNATHNKAVKWLEGIIELEKNIEELTTRNVKIQQEIEEFAPKREQLARALKAAELDGHFVSLDMTRRQQKADSETLANAQKKLPVLEQALIQQKTSLELAEKACQHAKKAMTDEGPILTKVRALDLKAAEKNSSREAAQKEMANIEKQLKAKHKRKQENEKLITTSQKQLDAINSYLEKNANDESLVSEFSAISQQLAQLQTLGDEIQSKQEAVEKEQKAVAKFEKAIKASQKAFDKATKTCEKAKKDSFNEQQKLDKLLNGQSLSKYRENYRDLLNKIAEHKAIVSYEEARKTLADGSHCPLCGATEHPWAEGNVPEINQTKKDADKLEKLIEQAEALIESIQTLEKAVSKAEKSLSDADKKLAKASHDIEASQKEVTKLEKDAVKAEKANKKAQVEALKKLEAYGIAELPEKDVESIIKKLKTRLAGWQEQQTKKIETEKQINQISAENKEFSGSITALSNNLDNLKKSVAAFEAEYKQLINQRSEIYADKNPDEVEITLNKAVNEAEKAEKTAREAFNLATTSFNELKVRIVDLTQSVAKREKELSLLENAFVLHLEKSGFAKEADFAKCRLSSEQRHELQKTAQKLDEAKTQISALKKDREQQLEIERQKKVTDKPMDELQAISLQNEEALRLLGQEIGAIAQKLSAHQQALSLVADKMLHIEAQQRECLKFARLNSLIGSKNGNVFRNFAQGLTFEMVVSQANKQLTKMTDRYILIRNSENPLTLNVIDTWQAGLIRTTQNLSGGESFIISLALALGLSKIVSNRVSVDSLFLDEGFGTLDEDALETALSTLAGLQQDGKLIGVISHVLTLKDRISTQITVTPTNGGRSILSGPGCVLQVNFP